MEYGKELETPGVPPEPMPGSKKFNIKYSSLNGKLNIDLNNPDMDMRNHSWKMLLITKEPPLYNEHTTLD